MKQRYLVGLLILVIVFLGGCQAAPDLNQPWNTATPQFASSPTAIIAAPAPTQAPTATATVAAAVEAAAAQAAAVKATVEIPTATAPAAVAADSVKTSSNTTLAMAGAEDNPPFMYADSNGKTAGLYLVLLDAIFKRMGTTLTIKTYPWNRALAMGTSGEAPLAGIYKNEERLKIFDYSDALYPNKILIYVQKGKTFPFTSPSDLRGKNVGTMSGWTYGDAFDQAKAKGIFTTEEVAVDKDNFQKLALGRLDCVLAESTIAGQIIQEQNYGDKVEVLPTPMIVFDAYVVFAKSAKQTELIKTFNTTLAAMKKDGSYEKLVADWSGKK